MKAKKFDRKLVLKKETVTNLNVEELSALYGGDLPNTWETCRVICGPTKYTICPYTLFHTDACCS